MEITNKNKTRQLNTENKNNIYIFTVLCNIGIYIAILN